MATDGDNRFSIDVPASRGTVAGTSGCALRMVNIQKRFGLFQALRNINLEVGTNEIVGLLGDNGAGKSTMVKILTGVYAASSGGRS